MINKWCSSAVSISVKSHPTTRREKVTLQAEKSLTRMEVYWRALNSAWARLERSRKNKIFQMLALLPLTTQLVPAIWWKSKSIRTLHLLSSSRARKVFKKVKHHSFTWLALRTLSGQLQALAAIKSAKTCSMSWKTLCEAIKTIQIKPSLRRIRTKSSLHSPR